MPIPSIDDANLVKFTDVTSKLQSDQIPESVPIQKEPLGLTKGSRVPNNMDEQDESTEIKESKKIHDVTATDTISAWGNENPTNESGA